ncbi:hypothetical protein SB4536_430004 [Klebsiella pneumoniae subsp. pneumoniae T69]|nr:hypothetical protein SB4536_430004 [Klebsiella pneumoniae subsp. pneumoniae T69]
MLYRAAAEKAKPLHQGARRQRAACSIFAQRQRARHGLTPYRGRQRSGTLFAACRSAPFYLARQYV